MFFFKKKTVTLDCFTYSQYILNNFPISPSEKYFPDWWKKLPKDYQTSTQFWKTSTMKKCRGFIDYYKNSFTLPLWSDLSIALSSNKEKRINWQFADRETRATLHDEEQRAGWLDEDHIHIKLDTPWAVKSKKDSKFLWSFPFYNYKRIQEYQVLPGVVDFKWQNSINVNMILKYEIFPRVVDLYAGNPLVNLTAISDENIKIKLHQISVPEFSDIIRVPVFTNFYSFKKFCPYR